MLDKKQEYIAEALDEIRDAYIDEAVSYEAAAGCDSALEAKQENTAVVPISEVERKRKKRRFYTIFAPIAACLVLVVSLGVYSWQGGFYIDDSPAGSAGNAASTQEAAGGAAADVSDGTDGKANAVGQLQGSENHSDRETNPGDSVQSDIEDNSAGLPCGNSQQSLLEYLTAEEILAKDTVIFRGTVESTGVEMLYSDVENGLYADSNQGTYTVITVKVSACLRGDLEAGQVCDIRIPGIPSKYEASIAGDLARLEAGDEAIFMPYIGEDGSYYYSEGIRFLFLQTESGVSYATDVYDVPSDGEVTLDDVETYLRKLLKDLE